MWERSERKSKAGSVALEDEDDLESFATRPSLSGEELAARLLVVSELIIVSREVWPGHIHRDRNILTHTVTCSQFQFSKSLNFKFDFNNFIDIYY